MIQRNRGGRPRSGLLNTLIGLQPGQWVHWPAPLPKSHKAARSLVCRWNKRWGLNLSVIASGPVIQVCVKHPGGMFDAKPAPIVSSPRPVYVPHGDDVALKQAEGIKDATWQLAEKASTIEHCDAMIYANCDSEDEGVKLATIALAGAYKLWRLAGEVVDAHRAALEYRLARRQDAALEPPAPPAG